MRLFLLPPGVVLLVLLYGVLRRRRRVALAGILLLYLLSLPPVATCLGSSLDVAPDPFEGAQAIVVLGGGSVPRAPEYGAGPNVTTSTLTRVRYGVFLQVHTGLPLLMVGGDHEGEAMARVAEQEFHAPGPVWSEDRSLNTHENALFSAEILRQHDIKTILLVSHSYHLRRARHAFAQLGLEVRCAPTQRSLRGRWSSGLFMLLPSADALSGSSQALEEWLGIGWYRLRYG